MRIERQKRDLAAYLFQRKRVRRRELAALSFPAKISVLVQLQQMASEVRMAAGRSWKAPWQIARSLAASNRIRRPSAVKGKPVMIRVEKFQ